MRSVSSQNIFPFKLSVAVPGEQQKIFRYIFTLNTDVIGRRHFGHSVNVGLCVTTDFASSPCVCVLRDEPAGRLRHQRQHPRQVQVLRELCVSHYGRSRAAHSAQARRGLHHHHAVRALQRCVHLFAVCSGFVLLEVGLHGAPHDPSFAPLLFSCQTSCFVCQRRCKLLYFRRKLLRFRACAQQNFNGKPKAVDSEGFMSLTGPSQTGFLSDLRMRATSQSNRRNSFRQTILGLSGILIGTLTMELGGKISIGCEKTGYRSELEFKLKVRPADSLTRLGLLASKSKSVERATK